MLWVGHRHVLPLGSDGTLSVTLLAPFIGRPVTAGRLRIQRRGPLDVFVADERRDFGVLVSDGSLVTHRFAGRHVQLSLAAVRSQRPLH